MWAGCENIVTNLELIVKSTDAIFRAAYENGSVTYDSSLTDLELLRKSA